MTEDVSIRPLLKSRVNDAKDKFLDYLNSLKADTIHASLDEINLFHLNYSQDGKVNKAQINSLRNSVINLDTNSLIDQGLIQRQITNDLFINTASVNFDINADGLINGQDGNAVNYLINFGGNPAEVLDQMLSIAGNEKEIIKYNVNQWAKARGLDPNSDAYKNFYKKFYTEMYETRNPKLSSAQIGQLVTLYDKGFQKNINDIDIFVPLIAQNTPTDLLNSLLNFFRSSSFDAVDPKASLTTYIAILTGSNIQQKNLVTEAITRKIIPIINEKLSASALDKFISLSSDDKAITKLKIEAFAKDLGLSNEKKEEFETRFYNKYFGQGKAGVSLQELSTLVAFYKNLKTQKKDFKLEMLDPYADAIKKKIPPEHLKLILNFELSKNFVLENGKTREGALEEIFNILAGSNTIQKQNLLQAIKTNALPISGEEPKLNKLLDFIYSTTTEASFINANINAWADAENLSGNEKLLFLNNFQSYYKKLKDEKNPQGKLKQIFDLYKNDKLNFNQLDKAADILKIGVKPALIKGLSDYKKKYSLNSDKITELLDILKNNNTRQLKVLEIAFKSNSLPYTATEANPTELFRMLAQTATEDGERILIAKNYAALAGITSDSEKNNFAQRLTEWSREKNIPINKLKFVSDLYKENIPFTSIEALVDGLTARVDDKDFATLVGFVKTYTPNKSQIQKYVNILKGTNQDQKNILLSSIKNKRISLTGEALSIENLNTVLNKVSSADDLLNLQIDKWSKDLEINNREDFKEKLLNYKRTLGLGLSELSSLVGVIRQDKNNVKILDPIAKAIKNKIANKDIITITGFINNNARGLNEEQKITKLNEYFNLLSNTDEKNLILNSIQRNTVVLTSKSLSIENLDEAIRITASKDSVMQFHLIKTAKDLGLREGSSDYNQFMDRYYNNLYKIQNLKFNQIHILIGLERSGIFREKDYTNLQRIVISDADQKNLNLLKNFITKAKLGQEQISKYLGILAGPSSPQKDLLAMALKNKTIPIANLRI